MTVEKKQARFHEWLKTEGLVQKPNQANAVACTILEELTQFWMNFSRRALGRFDNQYEKGVRRWVRGY